MTLKEFFRELRKTPRKWRLAKEFATHDREIIRLNAMCPLVAVCKMKTGVTIPVWQAREAGRLLGIREWTVFSIIFAADHRTWSWRTDCWIKRVRKELLRATGLKELKEKTRT